MNKELGPLIRVVIQHRDGVYDGVGEMCYFRDIRDALAKLDLHVVDGKDLKILEAMGDIPTESMGWAQGLSTTLDFALQCELDKREANAAKP